MILIAVVQQLIQKHLMKKNIQEKLKHQNVV